MDGAEEARRDGGWTNNYAESQEGPDESTKELDPTLPSDSNKKDSPEKTTTSCDPFKGPVTRTRSRNWGYFHVSLPTQGRKRRYTRGGEKVCAICRKITKSPSDLERHVRVHTGERPFQCVECRKPFKCKRSQQSHQYLYHGISDGISQSRIDLLACQRMLKQWPSAGTEIYENGVNISVADRRLQEMPWSPVTSIVDNDDSKEDKNALSLVKINDDSKCSEGEKGEDGAEDLRRHSDKTAEADCDMAKLGKESELKQQKSPPLSTEADRMAPTLAESGKVMKSATPNEKVEVTGGKSVTCHRCGRGFKTVYTLRYHQRAIHGLMVYLSPALEDRLLRKKGCWRRSGHWRRPTMVPVPYSHENKESNRNKLVDSVRNSVEKVPCQSDLDRERYTGIKEYDNKGQTVQLKDKGIDYSNPFDKGVCMRTRHLSFPLDKERDVVSGCGHRVPNSAFDCSRIPEICRVSVSSPDVLLPTPHVVRNGEVSAELQLSWQSVRIESEKVFVARVEAVNPATEQRYVLYKCCLCGSALPGLRTLCAHLIDHMKENDEKTCELCGAVFKWSTELELHRHLHQSKDSKMMVPPFQPNFHLNSLISCTAGMPIMHHSESNSGMTNHLQHPPPSDPYHVPSLLPPRFCPLYSSTHHPEPSDSPPSLAGHPNSRRISKGSHVTFQCRHCPKIFDRVFSLQRHERVHTGIKPCFCTVCGRGFSELRNLRHHNIRFHPDGCHRELLPRGRKPGRPRNINSSMKLVSSLKKTAVRILNSVEQQKTDALSVNCTKKHEVLGKEDSVRTCNNSNTDNRQPCVITSTSDLDDAKGCHVKQPSDKPSDNESVTVVIPTDVSQGVPFPLKEFSSPREFSNEDQENKSREVLQDPKRSLIGNRRKCRPFRLVSQGQQQEKTVETLPTEKDCSSLDSFREHKTLVCGEDVELQHSQEACPKDTEEKQLSDSSSSGTQGTQITEEGPLNFKARLRGHGAFFSSYNPRLGVVARPVQRTEACKPQLGPDGKYLYPCSYCFKTFCSTSDLNRHMDFHEDIRPFKCPYCEYCSRTNSQLKVHMMRHQGIKQYLCQICNYNGVTQSDLNRHLKTRTHFLRSRNICSCCGIGFYTRSLSEEHYRICHQLKNSTFETLARNKQCGDSTKPISQDDMLSNVQTNSNMCTYFNGNAPLSSGRNALCKEGLEEKNNNDYHFNLKHMPISIPERIRLSSNGINGPNLSLSAS